MPNPEGHATLIRKVLEQGQIDPRTITYVEAHGTGTALGDPIEIAGLVKAFGCQNGNKHSCAIGSVKSNIGHLEAAAGMAALAKVLLQMQHRQLAPSLHANRLNPNIDFKNSPFHVQTELSPWKQVELTLNGSKRLYPRRAGISSFGAGGSNAHLVIEEYRAECPAASHEDTPCILVLSARNPERLKQYAADLKDYLRKTSKELNLADVAYTLQTGREAMETRLALVAGNKKEACKLLENYLDDSMSENIYYAQADNRMVADLLGRDEDSREIIDRWVAKGKLENLARLWVAGVEIEWQRLYQGISRQRVSLPTYPFEPERYWIKTDLPVETIKPAITSNIQPTGKVTLKKAAEAAFDFAKPEKKLSPPKTILKMPITVQRDSVSHQKDPVPSQRDSASICQQLKEIVGQVLYIQADKIDVNAKFSDLGLIRF